MLDGRSDAMEALDEALWRLTVPEQGDFGIGGDIPISGHGPELETGSEWEDDPGPDNADAFDDDDDPDPDHDDGKDENIGWDSDDWEDGRFDDDEDDEFIPED